MRTIHQTKVDALLNKIRVINNSDLLPRTPSIPNEYNLIAQAKLIMEEFMETMEACGITVCVRMNGLVEEISRNDMMLSLDKYDNIQIDEVAKEIADLSVVTTGMFSEFGVDDYEILDSVDDNNLAKFGPGGYLNENRKWIKPPNHPKPNIKAILDRQG